MYDTLQVIGNAQSENFFQGFGVFFGVLAGIIAGTAITLLVEWLKQKRSEQQMISNLKFEFGFNIQKIDTWLSEISNYRNAIIYDNLHLYFAYFDLARVISVTANSLYSTGKLYKYLDNEDIGKLQIIFSDFSYNGEDYMSRQMHQNKTNFLSGNTPDLKEKYKTDALKDVAFWEDKFKEHKDTLQKILAKL